MPLNLLAWNSSESACLSVFSTDSSPSSSSAAAGAASVAVVSATAVQYAAAAAVNLLSAGIRISFSISLSASAIAFFAAARASSEALRSLSSRPSVSASFFELVLRSYVSLYSASWYLSNSFSAGWAFSMAASKPTRRGDQAAITQEEGSSFCGKVTGSGTRVSRVDTSERAAVRQAIVARTRNVLDQKTSDGVG